MTEWYCTFHYPRNWIEVVHRPDPAGLPEQCRAAVEGSFPWASPATRQELTDLVTRWMQEDAERDAAVSAHGYDDGRGLGVHMHLTMWVAERSLPESVDEELRLLSDTVREAGANVEPPQVTEVSLPAGRALRVRQRDQAADPTGRTDGLDTVDYWVPVEASNDLLWLHFWAAEEGDMEEAVALFDQMAEAFTLEGA